MSTTRQLAAIMFTDIAGYTALMGQGESRALLAVEKNREIQMPLVKEFGGHWHKDLGDGSLCSFNSTVNAVQCAIAIQNRLLQEVDFKVRIGIHLGDVTFSNGDVFGDGVNIAARIETEAMEGGICVSESVYRSIKSNDDIETVYFGKRKLKNVSETIKLYQIKAPGIHIKNRNRKFQTWAVFGLVLIPISIVAGILGWNLKPVPDPGHVMRFSVVVPEEITRISGITLSNDGKTLVFAAEIEDYINTQMFLRPMNSLESKHITEVDFLGPPVFSPDDTKVAFGARGKINVYSLGTGVVNTIGSAASINIMGQTWLDNALIYGAGVGNNELVHSLLKISFSGAEADNEIVISPEPGSSEDFHHPFYIHEVQKLLYQVSSQSGPDMIRILDLTDLKSEDLLPGQTPKYISTGHLLFKDGSNLMAVRFNPHNPENLGNPVRLLSEVEGDLFSVSSNGTLVYVHLQKLDRQPGFVDNEGIFTPIPVAPLAAWASPRWSPDNSKIVFRNSSTNSLWLYDIAKQSSQLLLDHDSNTAIWLPDGKKIAYRDGSSGREIFTANILNSNQIDTLVVSNNNIYPVSFASDVIWLFYDGIHSTDRKNIMLFNREKGESISFLSTTAWECMAQFSPDDQLVVYVSDETGQYEIYIKKFPDTGEKWLISDGGGTEPRWSKDGKEIFYRNGNRIMKVPITTGMNFDYGSCEIVLEGPYPGSPFQITNFDVSHDGKKFLMLKPVSTEKKEINVIVNWFVELKELMRET